MRSFRRAAIAGATAVSLLFGASTVAGAEEAPKQDAASSSIASLSYRVGDNFNADKEARGVDLFGFEKNLEKAPAWAKIFYGLSVAGVIGSILGLVVFPAYNFLLANGFLR